MYSSIGVPTKIPGTKATLMPINRTILFFRDKVIHLTLVAEVFHPDVSTNQHYSLF